MIIDMEKYFTYIFYMSVLSYVFAKYCYKTRSCLDLKKQKERKEEKKKTKKRSSQLKMKS